MPIGPSVARTVALVAFLLGCHDYCNSFWCLPTAAVLAACYFPAVRDEENRLAWQFFIPLAFVCSLAMDDTAYHVVRKLGWTLLRESHTLLYFLPFAPLVSLSAIRAVQTMRRDDLAILCVAVRAGMLGMMVGLGAMLAHLWLVPVLAGSNYAGYLAQSAAAFALGYYSASCFVAHRLDTSVGFPHLHDYWKIMTIGCVAVFGAGVVVWLWL